jgi:hypothetical protein
MGQRAIRGFNAQREIAPAVEPTGAGARTEVRPSGEDAIYLSAVEPNEGRGGQWEPCPRQCIILLYS